MKEPDELETLTLIFPSASFHTGNIPAVQFVYVTVRKYYWRSSKVQEKK